MRLTELLTQLPVRWRLCHDPPASIHVGIEIIETERSHALFLTRAQDRVDLARAREVLESQMARFVISPMPELITRFDQTPPFGSVFGWTTVIDQPLDIQPELLLSVPDGVVVIERDSFHEHEHPIVARTTFDFTSALTSQSYGRDLALHTTEASHLN